MSSGTSDTKIKLLLNCLRVIWFFSFQKSMIKKRLKLQQIKKKNSGFILATNLFYNVSFRQLPFIIFTILPYLKMSYGRERSNVLSNPQGELSLAVSDITFFSHYLNEKHVEWDRQFNFSFSFKNKKISRRLWNAYFFHSTLLQGFLKRLFWSALTLNCNRGHSGWLEFSKISNHVFLSNNYFFKWNFWF
jgi:hypothetical protein